MNKQRKFRNGFTGFTVSVLIHRNVHAASRAKKLTQTVVKKKNGSLTRRHQDLSISFALLHCIEFIMKYRAYHIASLQHASS